MTIILDLQTVFWFANFLRKTIYKMVQCTKRHSLVKQNGRNKMNLLKTARTIVAASAAFASATMINSVAQAQSLEDTYKGKTVTIMLGHPPGGSYDLYSQLAAEFLGKHIPGNPEIIVQHRPGGGGRKGQQKEDAASAHADSDDDGISRAPSTVQPKAPKERIADALNGIVGFF